ASPCRGCAYCLLFIVFHALAWGAAVPSLPDAPPSRRNWTPATPTLSDAPAVTVRLPLTVAPGAGAVMLTVGAVVSLNTVTVTAAAVAVFAAASRATAVSVCAPLRAVVVFHAIA